MSILSLFTHLVKVPFLILPAGLGFRPCKSPAVGASTPNPSCSIFRFSVCAASATSLSLRSACATWPGLAPPNAVSEAPRMGSKKARRWASRGPLIGGKASRGRPRPAPSPCVSANVACPAARGCCCCCACGCHVKAAMCWCSNGGRVCTWLFKRWMTSCVRNWSASSVRCMALSMSPACMTSSLDWAETWKKY